MRFLIPLIAAFVLLHDPQGNPIYVNKDQIISVGKPFGWGHDGAGSKLTSLYSFFFVKENPEEVIEKFK